MTWNLEKIEQSSWIIEKSTWTLDTIVTNISSISNWSIKEISETVWILEKYFKVSMDYLGTMWPKFVWAILVLWIWFKIINFLNKGIDKAMEKAKIDPMIKTFLSSFLSVLLKIMVILTAVWMLGIQTTSFLALFTAAWVAIWMSLSWTLQNFAWGIIILIFKLYQIWDFISIWNNSWTVKSIHIFHTIIITPDKKTIIIPNSQISNWAMTNFNVEPVRRLDVLVWVDYDSDIDFVREIFTKITEEDSRILKSEDYQTSIFVSELLDSSVQITVRCFVNCWDLFAVKWDLNEKILNSCRKNNIKIPFPQRDVHIYNK